MAAEVDATVYSNIKTVKMKKKKKKKTTENWTAGKTNSNSAQYIPKYSHQINGSMLCLMISQETTRLSCVNYIKQAQVV